MTDEPAAQEEMAGIVLARFQVTMDGIPAGSVLHVDTTVPDIKRMLKAGYIVPLEPVPSARRKRATAKK